MLKWSSCCRCVCLCFYLLEMPPPFNCEMKLSGFTKLDVNIRQLEAPQTSSACIRIQKFVCAYAGSCTVCGRSLVGIAGSNPAPGDMDVCLWWVLCVVQVEISATGRSLVQSSPTEWVWSGAAVTVCTCSEWVQVVRPRKKKEIPTHFVRIYRTCETCGVEMRRQLI